MNKLIAIVIVGLSLGLWTVPVLADMVRYVSDKLEIPIRSGKSRQHRILRMLAVGTKVLVLATENNGYSKVQLGELEGWILTRQLMGKPSAQAKLAKVQQRLAETQIKNNRLQEKIKTLGDGNIKIEIDIDKLRKKNIRLQQDNASIRKMASNTIAIANKNKQLEIEISKTRRELDTSRQEAVRLKDAASKDWFLYGSGVAVFSIFIGMLLARMGKPSRSSW